MLSGLSFRWACVFIINSLILSSFPLTSFHLAEANLVPRAEQFSRTENLFFTFLLQQKDAVGTRLSAEASLFTFSQLYILSCAVEIFVYDVFQYSFCNQPVLSAYLSQLISGYCLGYQCGFHTLLGSSQQTRLLLYLFIRYLLLLYPFSIISPRGNIIYQCS